MTRREYFEKIRNNILELDDQNLGIYVLHFMGSYGFCNRNSVPFLKLTNIDLNNRLFPESQFTNEHLGEQVYANPSLSSIQKSLDFIRINFSSVREKENYESVALAIGQKARALIQNNPVERWNVLHEQINSLEIQWKCAEKYALSIEENARKQRTITDELKTKLDKLKIEIESL